MYICNNEKDSINAVKEIFDGKFGPAKNVLIEEFLNGEEMSFLLLVMEFLFKNLDSSRP